MLDGVIGQTLDGVIGQTLDGVIGQTLDGVIGQTLDGVIGHTMVNGFICDVICLKASRYTIQSFLFDKV